MRDRVFPKGSKGSFVSQKAAANMKMAEVWLSVLLVLVLRAFLMSETKDVAHGGYLLFVGTYTGKESKGIYAYRFDTASGQLTPLGLVAKSDSPSFLAIDPTERFLYAVNELEKYKGDPTGSLSAF